MLIRKWQEKDNLAISQLESVCFDYPWSYQSIQSTFQLENFVGLVAEEDEKVIGYIGAICAYDEGDIALVAVAPDFRRKGYAQNMIEQLFTLLKDKKIERIFLEVRVSNNSALKLYQKTGFAPVGLRKNYYENSEDAIVMLKVNKLD